MLKVVAPMSSNQKAKKVSRLIKRDGRKCSQCGTHTNLTIEHVVPKAIGGGNNLSNLKLLCEPCNQSNGKEFNNCYRNGGQWKGRNQNGGRRFF